MLLYSVNLGLLNQTSVRDHIWTRELLEAETAVTSPDAMLWRVYDIDFPSDNPPGYAVTTISQRIIN